MRDWRPETRQAGILLEAAITTIQDCEDSVAAVDAEEKVAVYSNWLGLMKGDLQATFAPVARDLEGWTPKIRTHDLGDNFGRQIVCSGTQATGADDFVVSDALSSYLMAQLAENPELDADPDVMRFINGGRPTPREEIETEFLPAFLGYYERYAGYGFWAAVGVLPSGATICSTTLLATSRNSSDCSGEIELR